MDSLTEELKENEQLIKELLGEELGEKYCERLKSKCEEIDILRLRISVTGGQLQLECATNATFAKDFDITEVVEETANKFNKVAKEQMPKITKSLSGNRSFLKFIIGSLIFRDIFGKEN